MALNLTSMNQRINALSSAVKTIAPGPANMVTTDTNQTITGTKTIEDTSILFSDTGSGASGSLGFDPLASDKLELESSGDVIITTTDKIEMGTTLYVDSINSRVGINVPVPTEDLEIDGNIQIDTAGLGRLVFYDKAAAHEHGEVDADVDGVNGGQVLIKTKEDGGSVSEKLRIDNIGRIGLGGANYGTSGQVLTSNGASAPTWSDAGVGGLPIYTTTERDLLPTQPNNTTISNSTTGTLQMWSGTTWIDITPTIYQFLIDYLVIAGGGGGSGDFNVAPGGGGGAGGYRTTWAGASGTELSGANSTPEAKKSILLGTSYSIQVGGGGLFGFGTYNGNPGADSVFDNIISAGGGGGATNVGANSRDGGSGGGARVTGGSGTANQGFNGGNGSSSPAAAGGGGGAGAAGQNSSSNNGGDGGNGLQSTITGVATYRAGGGGGGVQGPSPRFPGTGGLGGGGNADNQQGTDGTGGGGGGNSGSGTAGRGGDGVIILRFPSAYTISAVGFTGLTMSAETSVGADKYVEITCSVGSTTGTGSVVWN